MKLPELSTFIFKLGLVVMMLLVISSVDIEITIHKRRTSLIGSIMGVIDSGMGAINSIKGIGG